MRWVLIVLLAMSARARADEPWAAGVTEAQKAQARALLERGNAAFLERDYVGALQLYRQAVAAWDHPAIRFNIVRCMIQLDRPLEAADELALALAYGAKPLEDSVYAEALAYEKLLANQIGHVVVRCTQPGVEISLDGQHVLACPGQAERRVAPGTHQIVGTRAGFAARTARVVVVGAKREEVAVALEPLATAGVVVHRWSTAVPWLVVAGGAVVTGVGALIDYQASRDMSDYDRALIGACLDVGCGPDHPLPASVADMKARARHESELGIGIMIAGGATAIAGGVLAYLNRGRTIYPSEHVDAVGVTPHAGGAALTVLGHF